MNAQQLKNAILQEAIEGRLVPQDPNDEPASALLARIRQEKEQLVKAGKLKKKDLEETPISEDEIPFEIPESWEWVRFSHIYWQLTDGTHSTPKYTMSGIPFLSVKDMSSGKLSFSNTKYISLEEHLILSQRCHPQKGDLLLSKVGTTGVPLIIDSDIEFSIFVSLALVKFFSDLIDSRYLLYLINSPLVQLQVAENTRGVGNKNWVLKAISDTIMVLPPLAEQKRIVAKIEELLPKVEEYGKAQEALNKLNEELPERLKKSVLQEAITGRLVPQDPNDEPASVLLQRIRAEKERLVKEGKLKKKDLEETPISEDEKPFEIPKGWVWVRWGALGEYKKGPFGSSLTKSMFVPKSDKAIKVYEQKNAIQKDYSLGEYYISEEKYEEMKGFTIHPGDIIVSCAGTIGETYLLPQEAPVGIINQALMRAKIHLESIIPYWLLYFRYILLIENRLKGAGSAIKNIPPFEVLKAMPVALPPLAEQKRIVAKIEELFAVLDSIKESLEA